MAGKVGSLHPAVAEALGKVSGQRVASIKAMVKEASRCNGYYEKAGKTHKPGDTSWFTTPLPRNTMKRLAAVCQKTGMPRTSLLRGIIFATLPVVEKAMEKVVEKAAAPKVTKRRCNCGRIIHAAA